VIGLTLKITAALVIGAHLIAACVAVYVQ